MEICDQLWRYHGCLHVDQYFSRQALGPVSLYPAEPVPVDARSDPGPGDYDEPESPGYERSAAERTGLQREFKSRAGDRRAAYSSWKNRGAAYRAKANGELIFGIAREKLVFGSGA